MKLTSLLRSLAIMAVLSTLSLLALQTAQAQTESVLYNFCSGANCSDGQYPIGPLIDVGGAFYSASESGGTGGAGTVFGLSPEPAGGCGSGVNTGNGWCEFVLYDFCSVANCTDGNTPLGTVSYLNAHFRTPGNFYGTTYLGGSHNAGTVFEVFSAPIQGCPAGSNRNPNAGWCETVLYNFCSYNIGISCSDGFHPSGNLVEDSSGNLYGVVVGSAQNGVGGVFELSPNQQGGYDEGLLYSDNFIQIGLAIDSNGNLYGTDTNFGLGQANVFKIPLSNPTNAQVIYTFKGTQGFPTGVTLDSAGNIYGATYTGGSSKSLGTVWKLSPVTTGKKAGTYAKKNLHVFNGEKSGEYPETPVTLDSSGNIYGTALGGDTACAGDGCGILFELAVDGDTYEYKHLWNFNGMDGTSPYPPILTGAGTLFGVAGGGGTNGSGAMYELTF